MKNGIVVLVICAAVFTSGCNMKGNDEKNKTVTASDSSLMSKTDTSANVAVTAMRNDSNAGGRMMTKGNDSALKVNMAKPDLTKKGKKGRITIAESVARNNGNMDMDKEGFYVNTEVLPAFPGGQKALEKFFENNIQYPTDATDNGIEGTVDLNFAVDERGKVYAPKVTSDAIGYGVEKEALRVFAKMPVWTPGKIKGKNVKTKYTLPIKFQLY